MENNKLEIKSIEYSKSIIFNKIYNEEQNIEYLNVMINSQNYSCEKMIYLYDGLKGILEIFEQYDKNWNKENFRIEWESIECDLKLSLQKKDNLGHILFKIEIQNNTGKDYWKFSTDFILEFGNLNYIIKELKFFITA